MSQYARALIITVWIVAVIGCLIMKKIQPEWFKLYVAYAIFICVIFTAFSNILV